MNSKLFSVDEIKELYENIDFNKKGLIFLMGCCLIILLINYLGFIFFKDLKYYLFLLLFSPVGSYFLIALFKISLKLIDGEEINFSDFIIPLSLFLKVLSSLVIYGLIVFIPFWIIAVLLLLNAFSMGFSGVTIVDIFLGRGDGEYSLIGILLFLSIILLFLIFAFYGLIKYMLSPFLIIDKQYNIISSFKKSAELTKGKKLKIFKCINVVSRLNSKKFFKIILIIIIFSLLIPIISYFLFPFDFVYYVKSIRLIYLTLFAFILNDIFISLAFVYRYLVDKNE